MRRALTALALVVALPLSAAAYLWDRDTPADEARGDARSRRRADRPVRA
ncbi:MAG: hypothetical protein LC745_04195 [Planctomycetia bacterium]|nr:hypothetical protein [Planctomycetia bacterium]